MYRSTGRAKPQIQALHNNLICPNSFQPINGPGAGTLQLDYPWSLINLDEALKMLRKNVHDSPSVDDFIHIVQNCRKTKDLSSAKVLHLHAQRLGFDCHGDVGNYLVPMFVECGSIPDAQQIFDSLPYHNVHSWTSLISGYVQGGHLQQAFDLYNKMHEDDVKPSSYTLLALLKACTDLEDVQLIHTEAAERVLESDLFVGSYLIDFYAKHGVVSDAHALLNKLQSRNIVSWTALIAGYAEHGPGREALACLEQMKSEGLVPNDVTYMCALKACGNTKALHEGRGLHSEIVHKGLQEDHVLGSSIVDMYVKCGSVVEAQKAFDMLPVQDIVSWNALIAGYTEHGPDQEVLECLEKMEAQRVLMDHVTFVYTLKACGNMGAMEKGLELHSELIVRALESDSFISSILVDMYSKCGRVSEAQVVFDSLVDQDSVTWNAIIKGCGMNHEGTTAIQYFEEMQNNGFNPDNVTFTCLLSACNHAKLASKGREIFDLMTTQYNITPTIDHYNCMVDMLSRAGRISEAVKFIEAMPCSPTCDMLTALLNACRIYAETELGYRFFEQLVQINSEWAVPYMLMEKIYSNAGRLEDANRIEELRKRAGAKKKPASALIEVNKKVYEFVVGDTATKEMSALISSLHSRTEKDGCVPNLDVIMGLLSNNAKEAALCDHAETLAIAFGLLNTPQGQTLRVTKNMRMCTDCHSRTKTISKMERREIIVRELYQVHRFKDGLCSCGDVC